jgi:monoamine oxidase
LIADADADVLIIGAGAAGLAAGLRLRDAGVSFLILEARSRLGGRAWTDLETFAPHPFDRGCHWLHSASVNPLRAIADRLQFHYDRSFTFRPRTYVLDGERASAAVAEEIDADIDAGFLAIARAGTSGLDVPVAEVVDRTARFYPVFDHIFGLVTSGTPQTVSTLDFVRNADGDQDYPVGAGLGALIAANARDLRVSLGTPVMRLEWSGMGVVALTDRGEVRASLVIVTASTAVLAKGGIRFVPELPPAVQSAIDACPLGCCEKVAFSLDAPVGEFAPGHYVSVDSPGAQRRRPASFYMNPFGRPLVIADIGGSFARELAAEGVQAMIDFALGGLVDILGSSVRSRIRRTSATGWTADPFVGGAYSAARPGMANERLRLQDPIGDRIFLAGEAVSRHHCATAHGAHLSGVAAAEKAIAALTIPPPRTKPTG